MEPPVSRRKLLGIGGTAASLSIAGCSFANDGSDGSDADGSGVDGTDDSENAFEVTVVADVDQSELEDAQQNVQAAQKEAQEGVEEGEMDQEEAQALVEEAQSKLEETQQELLSTAVSAIESHAEETDGLSVVETEPDYGLALLEGRATALVETLALEDVQAILDGSEYGAI